MTKAERVKLARSVRSSMSYYLLMQEKHIQEANPDHLERSMRAIRSAQEDLSQLSRAQGEVS